jgi:hypothetical protein
MVVAAAADFFYRDSGMCRPNRPSPGSGNGDVGRDQAIRRNQSLGLTDSRALEMRCEDVSSVGFV